MTISMGIVLVLGIIFWVLCSRYEWSIPLRWQAQISAWKERLKNQSYSLNFVWKLSPDSREIEKRFWLLQRALPSLQKKKKLPLLIEVQVCPDLSFAEEEKYIACLQRRFSEINIYTCSPKGIDSKGENPLS